MSSLLARSPHARMSTPMLWMDDPDPRMNTPSSRSGASAWPSCRAQSTHVANRRKIYRLALMAMFSLLQAGFRIPVRWCTTATQSLHAIQLQAEAPATQQQQGPQTRQMPATGHASKPRTSMCAFGSWLESTLICTTGISASGNMSMSGMKVPWSKPRRLSLAALIPADCSMPAMRSARCGWPGAGYCRL